MPDWPLVPLFAFLFAVACVRGGATYAVGRGVRVFAERRAHLERRPGMRRAERLVERYGAVAVTLCFLTVGVQTMVNAAAGGLRMPLARYVPALAAGALVWATVYVSLGAAVLESLWGGRPWVLPAVLVAVGLVAWLVHRRLRAGDGDGGAEG